MPWARIGVAVVGGFLGLASLANASERGPSANASAPPIDCTAYADGVAPAGPQVYLVPKPPKPNLPHCNVAKVVLATHELGQFRAVYGNDTPIKPSAAIEPVIEDLKAKAPIYCRPQGDRCVFRILIFAHGGLVGHSQAISDAERLAPAMMRDGYAPIFLVWNSDIGTVYGDRLCCVLDGESDTAPVHQIYFSPVRAVGDVGASVARSLENLAQELIRYDLSVLKRQNTEYYLTSSDKSEICKLLKDDDCRNIIYPFDNMPADRRILNGLDEPIPEKSVEYAAGFLPRIGTTTIGPEVGAKAWDNMVRRTRLAVEDSTAAITSRTQSQKLYLSKPGQAYAADPCAALTSGADAEFDRERADGGKHRVRSQFEPEGKGAFLLFFDRLGCEIKINTFPNAVGGLPVKVELYYFGHSMGALVGNEILVRHPELPWRRIVYMAAATPVRDFRFMVAPLLECRPAASTCADESSSDYVKLRFYSLMLHPLAESHDLEAWGLVPEGSLLEWIDEMFGGAKSVDDRMFGKWTNVEKTLFMFPEDARKRMTFRVFPAQAKMRDRPGPEGEVYKNECAPLTGIVKQTPPARCHPIMHGEFAQYSFWREDFLCGNSPCADHDAIADTAADRTPMATR